MTRHCAQCGRATGTGARFCSACGSPVDVDGFGGPVLDARRLADETSEVARSEDLPTRPELRPSPAGASLDRLARWWSEPQHRSLVAVAACGALLGAAVGLAFLLGGSASSGPAGSRPGPPAAARRARP